MQSNGRIAELLVQLMSGQSVETEKVLAKYAISKRTYQRDLAYVRNALIENGVGELQECAGTYRLLRQSTREDYQKALVTSHVLLGSRALTVAELKDTLAYLAKGLPEELQAELRQKLTLARGSYTALSRPKPLLERLHIITDLIAANQRMTFVYHGSDFHVPQPQTHHAQPVAVFFEVHYFYIAMLSEEHAGYWLYRLDRIVKILDHTAGQHLDYAHRFSLQDHRRQSYLLDSGSVTPIQFIYRNALQTVLDQFPQARVLATLPDGSHKIEAYVKVDGAMLWLLSQGAGVEVVSPPLLKKRMKKALQAALKQYQ
ncbi:helix-turn-helix transcriptional regulator [Lactiplantibacillus modestisalitolerans]|uniref:Helix-turn-helix transcriptional regulator n=1 Tax=Lactiplantibacillus modestisalitolerans TaxID=1457219 RepID=A0ABV5WTP4_9LACO|nr:WYL domain-containing protein [Lactiplantibacillus modestisalitolerans]